MSKNLFIELYEPSFSFGAALDKNVSINKEYNLLFFIKLKHSLPKNLSSNKRKPNTNKTKSYPKKNNKQKQSRSAIYSPISSEKKRTKRKITPNKAKELLLEAKNLHNQLSIPEIKYNKNIQTKTNNNTNNNENYSTTDDKKNNSFESSNNCIPEAISESSSQTDQSNQHYNPKGLLNRCHFKLATYIKNNKDCKLSGTKRFSDKSGEYYLKNVNLKKNKKGRPLAKKLPLKEPTNLENCFFKLKGNINKIKKRATKVTTILPVNSLTPIPSKGYNLKPTVANVYNKNEIKNAERTAVFIRRMEYSNVLKKNKKQKKNKSYNRKLLYIQNWWKTMYKIIQIQKNFKGFIFRKNLMSCLEHQERVLEFVTEFENIYETHYYNIFFKNMKDIYNEEKCKQSEKFEDIGEKLENLERLNNLKVLNYFFQRWKKNLAISNNENVNTKLHLLEKQLKNFVNRNTFKNLLVYKKQKSKSLPNLLLLKKYFDSWKINATKNLIVKNLKLNNKIKLYFQKNNENRFLNVENKIINFEIISKKNIGKPNNQEPYEKDENINNDIESFEEKILKTSNNDLINYVNLLNDDDLKDKNIGDHIPIKDFNFEIEKYAFILNKKNDKEKIKDNKILNSFKKDKTRRFNKLEKVNEQNLIIGDKNINNFINNNKNFLPIIQNDQCFSVVQKSKSRNDNLQNDEKLINKNKIPTKIINENENNYENPNNSKILIKNKEKLASPENYCSINETFFTLDTNKNTASEKNESKSIEKTPTKINKSEINVTKNSFSILYPTEIKNESNKNILNNSDKNNDHSSNHSNEINANSNVMNNKTQSFKYDNNLLIPTKKTKVLLIQQNENFNIPRDYSNSLCNNKNKPDYYLFKTNPDVSEKLQKSFNSTLTQSMKNVNNKTNKNLIAKKRQFNTKLFCENNINQITVGPFYKMNLICKPNDKLKKINMNSAVIDNVKYPKKENNENSNSVIDKNEKFLNDNSVKNFNKENDKLRNEIDNKENNKDKIDKKNLYKIESEYIYMPCLKNISKGNRNNNATINIVKQNNSNIKCEGNNQNKLYQFHVLSMNLFGNNNITIENINSLNVSSKSNKKGKIIPKNKANVDKNKSNINSKIDEYQIQNNNNYFSGNNNLKRNKNILNIIHKNEQIKDKVDNNKDKDKENNNKNPKNNIEHNLSKEDILSKPIDNIINDNLNALNIIKDNIILENFNTNSIINQKNDNKKNSEIKLETNAINYNNLNKNTITIDLFTENMRLYIPKKNEKQEIIDNIINFNNLQNIKGLRSSIKKHFPLNKKNPNLKFSIEKFDYQVIRCGSNKNNNNGPKNMVKKEPKIYKEKLGKLFNHYKRFSNKLLKNYFNEWHKKYKFRKSHPIINTDNIPKYTKIKIDDNKKKQIKNKNPKNSTISTFSPINYLSSSKYYPNKRQSYYALTQKNSRKKILDQKINYTNIYNNYKYNNPKIHPIDINKNDGNNLIFNRSYIRYDNITDKKNKNYSSSEIINSSIKVNTPDSSYIDDISSINTGEELIQSKNEYQNPINYASQSFFFKRNNINNDVFLKKSKNTNPMKMKGDFTSLISKNENLSNLKNPRIQVTNATCNLHQILQNIQKNSVKHDPNKFIFSDSDISDLFENTNNSTKNILKNVVENCDNDLYGEHRKYNIPKEKWVSMSTPLNNKNNIVRNKWKISDNIEGENSTNNSAQFELIQKNKITAPSYKIKTNNRSIDKRKKFNKNKPELNNGIDNSQYILREMNYSQFYNSPTNKEIEKMENNIHNNEKIVITNNDLRKAKINNKFGSKSIEYRNNNKIKTKWKNK